jgi:hypothetical protein
MDELEKFEAALRVGLTVEDFLTRRRQVIGFIHSAGLTHDYRLGKGRVKKLRDEVYPVACYVEGNAAPLDKTRFNLDNAYPDCIHALQNGDQRGIEVTVTQGRERHHLMIGRLAGFHLT